ncbi:MAG: DEAD/DEAH box helicase [Candidatus Nitrosocaldaceae archaeon]
MYRCPKCRKSIDVNKVENDKWLFYCKWCKISKIISIKDRESAYIEFIDGYDEKDSIELEDLLVKEGLIRRREEIDKMVEDTDEILYPILTSKEDYIVYYKIIRDNEIEIGSSIDELDISEQLKKVLKDNNITILYKFQEEVIKSILNGKDVVIVAPTASGKTESFSIPILSSIKNGFEALFVYPTKALARDQLTKIKRYANAINLDAATLDGDTTYTEKQMIMEKKPSIILTNFDTLHYHLIHRTEFSRVLNNVKYLVIDEVHTYNGIFGSHIHYIIKRLARFSKFQIIAASATLSNAKEFCDKLFERDMLVINGKGKRGDIHLLMIYPTLRSQKSLILSILKMFKDNKSIVFSDSHISAELLAYYGMKQGIKIKVHRAGLMKSYREQVEEEFKKGNIRAISATPTLELGIDIGDLDVVISTRTPLNRFIQRIGRAARKRRVGYTFLVFGNDPISQYYKNHPEDYLNDTDYAFIDPYNPVIQRYQVLAMICDKPLNSSYYDDYSSIIDGLIKEGLVKESNNRFIANYKDAIKVLHGSNIRGSGESVEIYLNNKKVGERALPIALEELHTDAVYFLAGKRYKVDKLDLDQYKAHISLLPKDHPYYTRALSVEWPSVMENYDRRYVYGMEVSYSLLHIKKSILGYMNIEISSDVVKDHKVMIDEVSYDFVTKGLVFRAPMIEEQDDNILISAYHALEHVIIEGSKMITGGASQDLGGISLGSSGLIFIYDGSVGGNGASRVLYDRLEDAIVRGKSILEECKCKNESGCPKCTYSYRCGNNNEMLHKYKALEVFRKILSNTESTIGEIDGNTSLI